MITHWTEKVTWEHKGGGIWLCNETGKFHYSDEVHQLDETPYDTEEQAIEALREYCKHL